MSRCIVLRENYFSASLLCFRVILRTISLESYNNILQLLFYPFHDGQLSEFLSEPNNRTLVFTVSSQSSQLKNQLLYTEWTVILILVRNSESMFIHCHLIQHTWHPSCPNHFHEQLFVQTVTDTFFWYAYSISYFTNIFTPIKSCTFSMIKGVVSLFASHSCGSSWTLWYN